MTSTVDRQFENVRKRLRDAADPEIAKRDKRYHAYDGYVSYGIMSKPLNEIIRELRPDLRKLPLEDSLDLAMRLVSSRIEEEASVALWILGDNVKGLDAGHVDYLDRFADKMASWSTTDGFSVHVIQPLLLRCPAEFLSLLQKWNQSDNRWKQRASVVAFTRTAGDSGRFLDETLRCCDALIWSEDDLVRKGVGWALRDAMRADKGRVLPYIAELRGKGVSSVITLYAMRDIKGEERERLLAVKKATH